MRCDVRGGAARLQVGFVEKVGQPCPNSRELIEWQPWLGFRLSSVLVGQGHRAFY